MRSISGRTNLFDNTGQWYYWIDGKYIPSTVVKSNTEAAAELCMASHAFGAQSHTSLLSRATLTAGLDGSYLISYDLETQLHKRKLSESGVSTLSANAHFIGQFPATLQNQTAHTLAHYDGILIIQDGLASVQF